MFAVIVTFQIAPGSVDAFLALVTGNARFSLDREPGCRRFDVLTDPKAPGEVVLYEIYDDEAAFRRHLLTDHFLAFDKETAPMVRAKSVRALAVVST